MAVITRPALGPPLRIAWLLLITLIASVLAAGTAVVGTRLLGEATAVPVGDAAVLVFDRWADGAAGADIYTVRADGTDLRQLTSGPDDEVAPAWSPDGTRIAYRHSGEGSAPSP